MAALLHKLGIHSFRFLRWATESGYIEQCVYCPKQRMRRGAPYELRVAHRR